MFSRLAGFLVLILFPTLLLAAEPTGRKPANGNELQFWLQNMTWHRYSVAEMAEALGLDEPAVKEALATARIDVNKPLERPTDTLHMLPYPGGRHPRIGFLEGAVAPQRETKFSVFTPWDDRSYVVVDLPEALWSNLGLTYLAHTHIDTIWSAKQITLPAMEWERDKPGELRLQRKLPNGLTYQAKATATKDAIAMELTLTNGTSEKLSDLRVQNCVMLKGAPGFAEQTNDNKRFAAPFVAVHNDAGDKWVITAWQRCQRAWGNAPCPCLHSDPKFRDLAPGEQQTIRGWLWFYQGRDIDTELKRLAGTHELSTAK